MDVGRSQSIVTRLSHGVGVIERVFANTAAVLMFAIMIIVSSDVGMRYLLNSPFSWSYDVISLYLMTALFYFALSRTFSEGAHISVDIAQYYLGASVRRLCQITYALLSAAVFFTIAGLGCSRALTDYSSGAATVGAILWPTWIADALVPLGAGLLGVRLVIHAAAHALSLATGNELIGLPALSGSEKHAEKGGFE